MRLRPIGRDINTITQMRQSDFLKKSIPIDVDYRQSIRVDPYGQLHRDQPSSIAFNSNVSRIKLTPECRPISLPMPTRRRPKLAKEKEKRQNIPKVCRNKPRSDIQIRRAFAEEYAAYGGAGRNATAPGALVPFKCLQY